MLVAVSLSPSLNVATVASVPTFRLSSLAGLPESVMTVVSSTAMILPATVMVLASLSTAVILPCRPASFGAFLSAAEASGVVNVSAMAAAKARRERLRERMV
jgi:hypothetical protein